VEWIGVLDLSRGRHAVDVSTLATFYLVGKISKGNINPRNTQLLSTYSPYFSSEAWLIRRQVQPKRSHLSMLSEPYLGSWDPAESCTDPRQPIGSSVERRGREIWRDRHMKSCTVLLTAEHMQIQIGIAARQRPKFPNRLQTVVKTKMAMIGRFVG
jgi:hypothetical protein